MTQAENFTRAKQPRVTNMPEIHGCDNDEEMSGYVKRPKRMKASHLVAELVTYLVVIWGLRGLCLLLGLHLVA